LKRYQVVKKGALIMIRLSTLLAQTRLELARHQVLAFKGRSLEICCLAGWLWITDGLGGEQVIQGGQRAVVCTKGKICVQALAPSAVRIAPDAGAFPANRVLRALGFGF